ncbi:MAG TPA: DUF6600 domain-containing protein [Verrucomicrobiae bacterium]|jgi:hypothetical protein|nr:DUF6600 domain-containing protein [Verrucomicrobiae bacterium]
MQCHRRLFVALMFLLAMLASAAWSQSSARIVRISDVEGQVDFDNGHGYDDAMLNIPITEGNWIRTRGDGWVEVQFEDGSTLRLAPETEIVFSELKLAGDGGTITAVDLNQGEAEFNIARHEYSSFQVNVRQKAILVRQSGRFRVLTSNSDPLALTVWRGEVTVRDPDSGEEVAVRQNETFALDPQDVRRYDLETAAEADDLDQWSNQRDEYLSRYAGNQGARSPYEYGVGDLDRYGQYEDVPGYGQMWQPYGVSLDWDPYENGSWCSTPDGYVWISAYRWGWLPYRYGHWVFIAGRGWFWEPGLWHRWHRVPEFEHRPPHFHPPGPPPEGVRPPKITGVPGPVKPPVRMPPPRYLGPPEDGAKVVRQPTAPPRYVGPPQDDPKVVKQPTAPPRYMGPPEDGQGVVRKPSVSPGYLGPPQDDPKVVKQPTAPPRYMGPPQEDQTATKQPPVVPGRLPPPSQDDQGAVRNPSTPPARTPRPRYLGPQDDQKAANPPASVPDKSSSQRYERPPQTDSTARSYSPPATPPPAKSYSPPPSPPPVRSYSPPPSPPAQTHTEPVHSSPPAHTETRSDSHADSSSGAGKPKR